jgi:hypothetical protein
MSKESKKNIIRIIIDILYCRFHYKVGISEYYNYKFDLKDKNYKKDFLSLIEKNRMFKKLNPQPHRIIADDKFITHGIFNNTNIPITELYLYYNPFCKIKGNSKVAYDYLSVVAIFMEKNIQSFVVKPIDAYHGEGVFVFTEIDYTDNDVMIKSFDKEPIPLSKILGNQPLIFERKVEQSEQFSKFNPTSINTIRFITSRTPQGNVKIHIAQLKIGRMGSCINNVVQLKDGKGNVNAFIDIETGIITNVINYHRGRDYEKTDSHPDTGEILEGIKINNWEIIKAQVIKYQQSLPYINMAGWDIAVTENGPIVIEVNSRWGHSFQLDENSVLKTQMRNVFEMWTNN